MITIKHKYWGFTFPVTPETFGPSGGNAIYEDVHLLKLGTVPFFDGTELCEYSWTSFFPKKPYSFVEFPKVPLESVELLENLKKSGEVVQMYIPSLKIQQDVQLRDFDYWQEKPGDIEYSIRFVEYRKIEIKTMEKKSAGQSNPGRPEPKKDEEKPKTYTVKSGDNLTKIAKKYDMKWQDLYEKNKGVIGSNPDLIKPGQVLTI